MRKLKKVASGLLAAAVMTTGFGGAIVLPSVNAQNAEAGERLVIFDANPLNLKLEDGASAAHGDFTWNGWNESTGTSAVKLEESTPYFRATIKDNSYKGLTTVNTGMRNAELCRTHGWFVKPEILAVLKQYVQVEFDVRWNGSSLSNEKLYILPAIVPDDNNSMHDIDDGEAAALVNGMDMGSIPANQWKSVSLPVDDFSDQVWDTGALAIGIWNGGADTRENPIQLDIRRFRLTVDSADAQAIHNALKAISGIDDIQWFTDDWQAGGDENQKLGLAKETDGSVNYFKLLTLYNADSDYRVKPAQEPRDLVIWDADPEKVSKTDGASAKPEWAIRPEDKPGETWDYHRSSAPKATGTSIVKYDQDIPYYSCNFTGQWDGGGAVLENGFNNRLADANMGWLEKREILTAIKDYLVIAYDVYVEGDTGDYTHINFEPVAEWSDKGPWDEYGNLAGVDVYEANTWVSHTKKGMETYREDGTHHWCCGDILVTVAREGEGKAVSADSPLTVNVRRLRVSLNESDKDAINAKLAAVPGIDNVNLFTSLWGESKDLPKDDKGNTDYFALLTAYDKQSAYSTDRASYTIADATASDAHGVVELPGTIARNGQKVTVAMKPETGWKSSGLKVSLTNGQRVEVTRTAPNGFTFEMPAGDVKIEATFERAPANDKSYVFWEANPDKASPTQTNGVSARALTQYPEWLNSTGVGTLQFDENVPYYRAVISRNDAVGSVPLPTMLHSGILGWSGNEDVMKALTAYAYIEFDVRRSGAEGRSPQLYMGPAVDGNGMTGTGSSSGAFVNGYTLDSGDAGEWVTVHQNTEAFYTNGNWWNGDFGLGVWGEGDDAVDAEHPITVDIRNLRIMVKESDRLALNETLSQISGIDSVKFFTADWEGNPLEIGTDSAGNKDYFSLLQAFDTKSPYSSHYDPHAVTVKGAEKGTLIASQSNAKKNVVVKLTAEPAEGYRLSRVSIVDSQNASVSMTRVDETHVVFAMPDDAVTITPVFVKETDKMQVLFYAESVAGNKAPQFSGETTLSYDGQGSAWDFKVTTNEGKLTIYGLTNTFAKAQIPEEAEITFRAKLTLADGSTNRTVTLGAEGSDKTKELTVGADWTEFTISAKDIADTLPSALTFSLSERGIGDVLSISEIQIWSKSAPGKSIQERFDMALDMSDYAVKDTNEKIGIIGDPDSDVSPWEVIYNDERPSMLGWSLAWFAQFRGESPWFISPKKEHMGEDYYELNFYHPKNHALTQDDMTSYMEEGYLEFFIKSEKDGLTVPFVITSTPDGGSEFNVPLRVTYDKSKARPDGYMRVRVPLNYLAAMGLPLDSVRWMKINGIQPFDEGFYLSAFSFFSNVAVEQPEPEPEPEPEPPTDFPFHLDTSLVKAVFDFDKMTLTVEENTPIWELLSGLIFDEENVGVLFFDAEGTPITDDSVILQEGMTMIVQRDGYDLGEYAILVVPADTIVIPDTGVNAPVAAAVLLGVSATLLAVSATRKKRNKKQLAER